VTNKGGLERPGQINATVPSPQCPAERPAGLTGESLPGAYAIDLLEMVTVVANSFTGFIL